MATSRACSRTLASCLAQDYPGPVRYVFGVADAADPAVVAVERLRAAFPRADLHLVVDPRRHGRNGKVSNLINMSAAITGEVVVLADSDMLVAPDYLTRLAGALQRPGVGAVTCLYRGISLPNLWSRLATGWVDGQFLPNVVLGVTSRSGQALHGLDHRASARDAGADRRVRGVQGPSCGRLRTGRSRPSPRAFGCGPSPPGARPYLRRDQPGCLAAAGAALGANHPDGRFRRLRRARW